MTDLNFHTEGPASAQAPKNIVVFLHGYGANGRDLIALGREWARDLPDSVFVSPDAPFPCDMANGMPDSFQWFPLRTFDPAELLSGVQSAQPILNSFLDKMLQEYDLKSENMALVGFSQGTMMSLYSGPRRSEKIAGILGYSGALVGDMQEAAHKPPIHLIHGESDEVVPVAAYHHACEALQGAGFTLSGGTIPGLGHGIDSKGLNDGAAFLKSIL